MLKIVKVNKDRGFFDGCYEVLSENTLEYQLKHIQTGKKITLYKCHCYHDRETIQTTCSLRRERAESIGRKK